MNQTVRLEVTNTGVAPIYRDAYFANGQQRSSPSLKGLLPGKRLTIELDDVDRQLPDSLKIHCDSLVPGQEIQFEADVE